MKLEAVQTKSTVTLLRDIVVAIAGSLTVAAAAQISIPMWPVSMTLQTLAVLMVGAVLGSRLGGLSLVLYGLEGAVGLPFFAGGKSGIFDQKLDHLLPSGSMGYVLGFIFAAWIVGRLLESGWASGWFRLTLAICAGACSLYVPGLVWLAIWAHTTQHLDISASATSALSWGLYPFIIGDALKVAIATLVAGATPYTQRLRQ